MSSSRSSSLKTHKSTPTRVKTRSLDYLEDESALCELETLVCWIASALLRNVNSSWRQIDNKIISRLKVVFFIKPALSNRTVFITSFQKVPLECQLSAWVEFIALFHPKSDVLKFLMNCSSFLLRSKLWFFFLSARMQVDRWWNTLALTISQHGNLRLRRFNMLKVSQFTRNLNHLMLSPILNVRD